MKAIFLLNCYGNLIGLSVFTLEDIGLLGSEKVPIPHISINSKNLRPVHQFYEPFHGLLLFAVLTQKSIHSEVRFTPSASCTFLIFESIVLVLLQAWPSGPAYSYMETLTYTYSNPALLS